MVGPKLAEVEARIIEELAESRATWPELPLDHDMVAAFAARIATGAPLARLSSPDLALAVWAGRGSPAAIEAFEAAHAEIMTWLERRFHRLPADEARQQLRIKLFVDPARIHAFSGFGSLARWLKVTATRLYLDLARGDARQRIARDIDQDDLLALESPATDPGVANLRADLRAAVKRAFADAVAALSPRERSFLRHVHVEGRTQDDIARTYGMSRPTVSRLLATARQTLLDRIRATLTADGTRGARFESLVAALDSRIDLALSSLLRP